MASVAQALEIGRIVAYDSAQRPPPRSAGIGGAGTTRGHEAPMDAAWRDAGRWLLTSGAFFLPQPRRKAIDRWLRGARDTASSSSPTTS